MPDVEVNAPEIDFGDRATPFRRRVAVLVVAITVFASVVAYLQTVESNAEDRAARQAQRNAVSGLGAQVEASGAFQRAYAIYTRSELLDQERAIAVNRRNRADEGSDLSGFEVERLEAARDSLTDISPLLSEEEFTEEGDDLFPVGLDASLTQSANEAGLRQEREAELANGHGSKADTYVAILTVLAVALFLLGLSLTVQGRSRGVLVLPGAGIALVCVGWAAITASDEVRRTPNDAIEAVAEGDRLMTLAQPEAAIEAYDLAIEERDDYAIAFGRRADAQFLAGSPQDLRTTGFVSLTDPEHLQAAIDDSRRAIELGSEDEIEVIGSLGFFEFLDGDLDNAARHTNQALDLNDQLPNLWFNLGLIEVARVDEDEAAEYFTNAISLTLALPNQIDQQVLFAAARTDLALVTDLVPDAADLAERFEADLVEVEAERILGTTDVRGADLDLGELALEAEGSFINATFDSDTIPDGTPLSFITYFRSDDDQPFSQPQPANLFGTFPEDVVDNGDGTSLVFLSNGSCLPPGDYRVEVFLEGERLATGETAVEPYEVGVLEREDDTVVGVSLCRPVEPEEWEITRDDTGFLVLNDPDGTASMAVAKLTVTAGLGDDALLDSVLELAGEFGDPVGDPVEEVVGNLFGITVLVEGFDGDVAAVTGAQDDDGVVRLIATRADTEEEHDILRREVAQQVGFFF